MTERHTSPERLETSQSPSEMRRSGSRYNPNGRHSRIVAAICQTTPRAARLAPEPREAYTRAAHRLISRRAHWRASAEAGCALTAPMTHDPSSPSRRESRSVITAGRQRPRGPQARMPAASRAICISTPAETACSCWASAVSSAPPSAGRASACPARTAPISCGAMMMWPAAPTLGSWFAPLGEAVARVPVRIRTHQVISRI